MEGERGEGGALAFPAASLCRAWHLLVEFLQAFGVGAGIFLPLDVRA